MPITDTQLKLITEEAEKAVPYYLDEGEQGHYAETRERKGYIAAATLYQEKLNLEREKAKELYFLVELIADGFPVTQDNAKKAIENYNR